MAAKTEKKSLAEELNVLERIHRAVDEINWIAASKIGRIGLLALFQRKGEQTNETGKAATTIEENER